MQIVYDANSATAHLGGRLSPEIIDRAKRALSYMDAGARYDWRFKTKQWDGRKDLLDDALTFPAGLVPRLTRALDDVEIEIIDLRPAPPWGDLPPRIPPLWSHDTRSLSIVLREHDQKAALRIFLDNPSGIIEHPTATGKTEEMAALLKIMRAYPGHCLVLQDRKGLMKETADRLSERLQERIGMIGDQHRDLRRRVIVCTQQALWARVGVYARDLFPQVSCVVVDECHDLSDNMGHKLLRLIPARVRLGLSATVKESNKRMIVEAYLGPVLHTRTAKDAIETGDIARPDCYMIRVGGMFSDELEPDDAYWRAIVTNDDRNRKIVEAIAECVQRGWPTLVLCSRIEHGERLEALYGMRAPFIHGQTPEDQIARCTRGLQDGRLPVLIASRIFDKGRNVPAVRAVILAGGLRSPLLTVQRIGRGLRRKDDDNRVAIIDFYDFGQKTMKNQSEDRRSTMRVKYGNVRLIGSPSEIDA